MAKPRPSIAPADIFARNLQDLMAGQPSITAVCSALDINRTQFNRYLSGESHPRPEVLGKICAHFGTDARILLEPLSEVQARAHTLARDPDGHDAFGPLMRGFDHVRMPDGLYQFILPNMIDPVALAVDLIRLSTGAEGVKRVQWSVPRFLAEANNQPVTWSARKLEGRVFQHADGVSFLIANPYARLMMHWFVAPGHRGAAHVHTGFASMSQQARPGQLQTAPLILRKLPADCGSVLAARRAQAGFTAAMLPKAQRQYLEGWRGL